jgi:flagellar motility protein MotE (MotC chaperone)
MAESYSKERKARRRLQSEQQELRQRMEALQKAEAQLKKWEDRKPLINHYMNGFTEMTK